MSLKQLFIIGNLFLFSGGTQAIDMDKPDNCPPYRDVWDNWEALKEGKKVNLDGHIYHRVTYEKGSVQHCESNILLKAQNHPPSPKSYSLYSNICAYAKKCEGKNMETMRIGKPVIDDEKVKSPPILQ